MSAGEACASNSRLPRLKLYCTDRLMQCRRRNNGSNIVGAKFAGAGKQGVTRSLAAFRVEIAVLSSPTPPSTEDFERVASSAPKGTLALCAIAVAIVFGIWIAFYFLAFLPRGLLQ